MNLCSCQLHKLAMPAGIFLCPSVERCDVRYALDRTFAASSSCRPPGEHGSHVRKREVCFELKCLADCLWADLKRERGGPFRCDDHLTWLVAKGRLIRAATSANSTGVSLRSRAVDLTSLAGTSPPPQERRVSSSACLMAVVSNFFVARSDAFMVCLGVIWRWSLCGRVDFPIRACDIVRFWCARPGACAGAGWLDGVGWPMRRLPVWAGCLPRPRGRVARQARTE